MRKVLLGLFFGDWLFGMFDVRLLAETPSLQQIVDKFNNNIGVKKNNVLRGKKWEAVVEDNNIVIYLDPEDSSINLIYSYDGNILLSIIPKELESEGILATNYLIDSIGQFHGYSEGEINWPLIYGKATTLENEGYEITKSFDGKLIVKIDVSKKIPLPDSSDVYIKVEDLEIFKELIEGDGFASLNKENIYFNKSGKDGDNTLIVAEKNELTENSYKSILSIIEVMFNSKDVVDYFKNNYPSVSSNKEFTGFKIEVNPTKSDFEESLFPDDEYKFLRITVNKEEVGNVVFGNSNGNNETNKEEDNVVGGNSNENNETNKEDYQTTVNPQTGIAEYIIGGACMLSVGLVTLVLMNNKNHFDRI